MSAQPLTPAAATAGNGDGMGWLTPALRAAALTSQNWPNPLDPEPPARTFYPRVDVGPHGVDARSVREARDFALATVRHWGAGDRSADIAVVVSELLTNALCHARPRPRGDRPGQAIRLGLILPGAYVLCAVADPSHEPPVLKESDPLDETGRGMRIVAALSDDWGYAAQGRLGKIVWATFSVAPQHPELPRP